MNDDQVILKIIESANERELTADEQSTFLIIAARQYEPTPKERMDYARDRLRRLMVATRAARETIAGWR